MLASNSTVSAKTLVPPVPEQTLQISLVSFTQHSNTFVPALRGQRGLKLNTIASVYLAKVTVLGPYLASLISHKKASREIWSACTLLRYEEQYDSSSDMLTCRLLNKDKKSLEFYLPVTEMNPEPVFIVLVCPCLCWWPLLMSFDLLLGIWQQ